MPRTGENYTLPSPPSPYQPNTTASANDIDTSLNDIATALTNSLNRAGGTMTSTLTLAADPTTNLQAATKQYVDGVTSYVQNNYVPRSGT